MHDASLRRAVSIELSPILFFLNNNMLLPAQRDFQIDTDVGFSAPGDVILTGRVS